MADSMLETSFFFQFIPVCSVLIILNDFRMESLESESDKLPEFEPEDEIPDWSPESVISDELRIERLKRELKVSLLHYDNLNY